MRRNSQPGRITGQNHAKNTLPGKPAGKTTANFPTNYVFITMLFLSVKHQSIIFSLHCGDNPKVKTWLFPALPKMRAVAGGKVGYLPRNTVSTCPQLFIMAINNNNNNKNEI